MRLTPAWTLNPVLDHMTIVQILIETPADVADAIAQLDGVDMLAIGANDLRAELTGADHRWRPGSGRPGQPR